MTGVRFHSVTKNVPMTAPKRAPNLIQKAMNFVIGFCIDFVQIFCVHDLIVCFTLARKIDPRDPWPRKGGFAILNHAPHNFHGFGPWGGARGLPKSTSESPPKIDIVLCTFSLQKYHKMTSNLHMFGSKPA